MSTTTNKFTGTKEVTARFAFTSQVNKTIIKDSIIIIASSGNNVYKLEGQYHEKVNNVDTIKEVESWVGVQPLLEMTPSEIKHITKTLKGSYTSNCTNIMLMERSSGSLTVAFDYMGESIFTKMYEDGSTEPIVFNKTKRISLKKKDIPTKEGLNLKPKDMEAIKIVDILTVEEALSFNTAQKILCEEIKESSKTYKLTDKQMNLCLTYRDTAYVFVHVSGSIGLRFTFKDGSIITTYITSV